MVFLPRIWTTAALTLLALTACNSTPPTAENSSPAAVPSPATTIKAEPKVTLASMKEIVAKTTAAVNVGNFDRARQEFNNIDEGYWSKVEDGVKAKSADTYKQVEDDMDNVTNGLKAAKPDKTKVLAALQSLSKTLDSYISKY